MLNGKMTVFKMNDGDFSNGLRENVMFFPLLDVGAATIEMSAFFQHDKQQFVKERLWNLSCLTFESSPYIADWVWPGL